MTISYIIAVIIGVATGAISIVGDFVATGGTPAFVMLGFLHVGTLLAGSLGLAFASLLALADIGGREQVFAAVVGLLAALATAWLVSWVLPLVQPFIVGLQALIPGG